MPQLDIVNGYKLYLFFFVSFFINLIIFITVLGIIISIVQKFKKLWMYFMMRDISNFRKKDPEIHVRQRKAILIFKKRMVLLDTLYFSAKAKALEKIDKPLPFDSNHEIEHLDVSVKMLVDEMLGNKKENLKQQDVKDTK